MIAQIGTGHPFIPTTGDLDFTPLIYAVIGLTAVLRWKLPLRLWIFPLILFVGGLVDTISDALGFSTLSTACVLALLALLVPPRRAANPPT
jgi:hypothetical protein